MPKKREVKLIWLKVITQKLYAYEQGTVNNWPPEIVIHDWFHRFPLESSHATRDAHHVGNTTKLLSVKEITEEQAMAEVDND